MCGNKNGKEKEKANGKFEKKKMVFQLSGVGRGEVKEKERDYLKGE